MPGPERWDQVQNGCLEDEIWKGEGQLIDLKLKIAWKCKNNSKYMGSGCF